MRRPVLAAAMSLWVAWVAPIASADTLVMRDGTRIEGTMMSLAGRTITFRHANGQARRYPTSRVEAVEFISADRPDPRATSGRSLEAGAELVVRTVETIDSRNAGADQAFSATMEQDVMNASGAVIIPERSSAQLMIRQTSAGSPTDSPELILDIRSIAIDGRQYLLSTDDMALESSTGLGRNRRTTQAVGAGAALGTIIGVIAHDGSGAVIGEVAGAADAQVLTRGRDVRVPTNTVIRFRLDKVVRLVAADR